MKTWLLSVLFCCSLMACKESQSSAHSTLTSNPDIMENKIITIQGKAENSKAGAMAGKYFLEGLQSWPDSAHGKTVEVTGKLKLVEHREEDLHTVDGLVNQGMVGTQYILQKPKWRVVGE